MGIVAVTLMLLFAIRGRWTSWEGNNIAQHTDDAYVRGDVTPMNTSVSETVHRVEVNAYETMKPGQFLMLLDHNDYRAAIVEEAKAALAGAKAGLETNQAAKRIEDARIQSAEAGHGAGERPGCRCWGGVLTQFNRMSHESEPT
jgi:membrane fusion protein (multidrug efflux system)